MEQMMLAVMHWKMKVGFRGAPGGGYRTRDREYRIRGVFDFSPMSVKLSTPLTAQ